MEILAFTFWVLFNIEFKTTVCAMFQGIVLAASARGEGAVLNQWDFVGAEAARAAGWSCIGRADLHGEIEKGLTAMSLPASHSPWASSRNLPYLKIWMLSKWYKCLAFSMWINMEKTANKLGKGRVWRWLWRVLQSNTGLVLSPDTAICCFVPDSYDPGCCWMVALNCSFLYIWCLSVRNEGVNYLVSILIPVSFG